MIMTSYFKKFNLHKVVSIFFCLHCRRKEKISHCLAIADAMCHSGVKGAPNFSHLLSIAIEILLQLCDDSHSDVRMIADESLNRVIRVSSSTNSVLQGLPVDPIFVKR
jgi:hypothetical protein